MILVIHFQINVVPGIILVFLPILLYGVIRLKIEKEWALFLYKKRGDQSPKWLERFGIENQEKIKGFLQTFAECFDFPGKLVGKISPEDEIMKFYERIYRNQGPDSLEAELFLQYITGKYKVSTEEASQCKTMGDLFEKINNKQ